MNFHLEFFAASHQKLSSVDLQHPLMSYVMLTYITTKGIHLVPTAFLLLVIIFPPNAVDNITSPIEEVPIAILDTVEQCITSGEHMVMKAATQVVKPGGSVWFRCEEVTGLKLPD